MLSNLDISRANQVWAADITYIPMARGFCYLVAIMDWASRKMLARRLSGTLDASFCFDALQEALAKYGTPEIFNTDQGSQFTSDAFIGILESHSIDISMDCRRYRLRHIAGTKWGLRQYLKMDRIEEQARELAAA